MTLLKFESIFETPLIYWLPLHFNRNGRIRMMIYQNNVIYFLFYCSVTNYFIEFYCPLHAIKSAMQIIFVFVMKVKTWCNLCRNLSSTFAFTCLMLPVVLFKTEFAYRN